jgi:lipoate-protein ligase A
VTVRRTGGSAVALGPGVLNYSVVESWRGTPPSLAHGFDLVCTPIVRALAKLGLKGAIGPAPGSFCDGKYNVLVHGKKIAGTAQRRTKRGDGGALLVHALVLVDADPGALTGVVQRFYERAGGEQRFDATVVTSLARQLPAICAAELRKRTAESLVQ